MPIGLKRFQQAGAAHYITFTCFHRQQHLDRSSAKQLYLRTLERVRRWYGFVVYAYVVMPEHVHLLVSEPERAPLSVAIQMLKQIVSRKLPGRVGPFWQRRYYDFNVWSEAKFVEIKSQKAGKAAAPPLLGGWPNFCTKQTIAAPTHCAAKGTHASD